MSTGARRVRLIVSGVLALAVVGGAVYGAGALLSPVPALTVTPRTIDTQSVGASLDALVLPDDGSTSVTLPVGDPIVTGSEDPRSMAGVAKLVLAHVVLAAEPLGAGRTGEVTEIDAATANRYRELVSAGARTVPVLQGQVWTRRDLLGATLIGSGNNIAELLMLEVFGGLTAYTDAARAWLDEQGLNGTTVVDATGLDSGNVSTAEDLARLAQLTLADPALANLFAERPREATVGATWDDEASFLADTGAVGLARTYTDAAGVVLLLVVPVGDSEVALAMLGQPGYPQAEQAARALIASLIELVRPTTLVSAGDVVGSLESDWGQSATLVAADTIEVTTLDAASIEVRLVVADRRTVLEGTTVGQLVISTPEGEQTSRVVAGGTIAEPGISWRFADPATIIDRWSR